jgi:hypothetical protein
MVNKGPTSTGLFISPSGIFELDCATTKTDTAERSISIGRESLFLYYFYLFIIYYYYYIIIIIIYYIIIYIFIYNLFIFFVLFCKMSVLRWPKYSFCKMSVPRWPKYSFCKMSVLRWPKYSFSLSRISYWLLSHQISYENYLLL